jgi:uncharacterized RDD family membrane protein YckC
LQKKPEEFALEYAGFWVRLGANSIDITIIALFLYVIYLIILEFFIPFRRLYCMHIDTVYRFHLDRF